MRSVCWRGLEVIRCVLPSRCCGGRSLFAGGVGGIGGAGGDAPCVTALYAGGLLSEVCLLEVLEVPKVIP